MLIVFYNVNLTDISQQEIMWSIYASGYTYTSVWKLVLIRLIVTF